MALPEENIAYQIKQGNELVFEKIFREYYARLCGYAMKYVLEKEEAEEIVQELFYNLWKKRSELVILHSVESYLFRAARNASLNFLKHRKIRSQYDEIQKDLPQILDSSADRELELLELQVKIEEAIELLPKERKKIFKLSRFEGLKYKDIAVELNISIKTVEAQMGKALGFLRNYLSDYLVILILLLVELMVIYIRHG